MIRFLFLPAFALSCAFAQGLAPNTDSFPAATSIKGLQVQMPEDALALGIQHAAININVAGVITAGGGFNGAYLDMLDHQIKPLSEQGVIVYAILIAYPTGQTERDRFVIHPGAAGTKACTVAGFDSVTPEGRKRLREVSEMMAERWSGAHPEHGRIWGWIVGNEVNSHGVWYGVGRQPLAGVVRDYEMAFRIIHGAVRSASSHARLYVPFDHFWTGVMPGRDATEAVPARDFLTSFAELVKAGGDLDWNVAWHPYPSNLGDPRIWADTVPTPSDDTPQITFKNLEVLCRHLERPELLWQGHPRHIILSEQGFHTRGTPEGPALQAAAFVYAWEKCRSLPQIDAFIYHRHVDHSREGGLALGLWTRKPDSIATPLARKPIHDLLKAAGTADWEEASAFARPLIAPSPNKKHDK